MCSSVFTRAGNRQAVKAEIRLETSASPALVAGMARLMPQLTKAAAPTLEELAELLRGGNAFVTAWQDGEMVGMGCLCVFRSPSGLHAHIEDVVVDVNQRGQGTGEALVLALLQAARQLGLPGVSLTCNPRREAANRLYTRLGFKQWQTNNYWIDLP